MGSMEKSSGREGVLSSAFNRIPRAPRPYRVAWKLRRHGAWSRGRRRAEREKGLFERMDVDSGRNRGRLSRRVVRNP